VKGKDSDFSISSVSRAPKNGGAVTRISFSEKKAGDVKESQKGKTQERRKGSGFHYMENQKTLTSSMKM